MSDPPDHRRGSGDSSRKRLVLLAVLLERSSIVVTQTEKTLSSWERRIKFKSR
jgi:hypothetical protein